MDLRIIILSQVSQTEKDKYEITYMWNLKKNDTSELLSFYFKNEEYVHRVVWKINQSILIH